MKTFDEVVRAVYRKDFDILESLTPDEANAKDQDGRNPLIHAVLADDADPDVVRSLISHGADVDAADGDRNWTALHFAARDQNDQLVRLLLESGAQVDPLDSEGNTPLWHAVRNLSSSLESVSVLLQAGADPSIRNARGDSPLDLASDAARADVLDLLRDAANE